MCQICPLINLDLPEPYLSIVKLLFYTVYQDDYVRAPDLLHKSNLIKNIISDPAKVQSSIAKLLLLNEMNNYGAALHTVLALPVVKIQEEYKEYIRRKHEYERYINESFSSDGNKSPDGGSEGIS